VILSIQHSATVDEETGGAMLRKKILKSLTGEELASAQNFQKQLHVHIREQVWKQACS
jgi:hypothetical protein